MRAEVCDSGGKQPKVMGAPYLGPQLAQSSECGDIVGSDGRECSGRQLSVSCGEFLSRGPTFEALRLFSAGSTVLEAESRPAKGGRLAIGPLVPCSPGLLAVGR